MTKIYTKKPLGIQDQIVRLKSLGLVIKDEAYAEKVLSEVSYFRFASLRNCCAHHSRLWNRYFNAVPQMKINLRGPWITDFDIDFNKLYSLLCVMVYLLDSMGFPRDWRSELLWK